VDSVHAVASDFLTRILADKRQEVLDRRAAQPEAVLREQCLMAEPPLHVVERLRGSTLRVIAEVKRGSPSAGTFNAQLNAADQAEVYAEAGAAAVSVLTDEPYFGGSLLDLRSARDRVSVPLLRKDFIVDPYQLLEARASGADLVLLIVAALDAQSLSLLLQATNDLSMTALVEINTIEEAKLAVDAGSRLVGINNRNLRTFEVDMSTTARLRPFLPDSTVVASLSGIKSVRDAVEMRKVGADVVLVGEALVRSSDAGALIAEMSSVT
jgi:indole-3-glycerol phosphate synthase